MKNKIKTKSRWLYFHTIDGCPAQYWKGEQICYVNSYGKNGGIVNVCSSLKQIKKEQKLSDNWRLSKGYPINGNYGYLRILKKPNIN